MQQRIKSGMQVLFALIAMGIAGTALAEKPQPEVPKAVSEQILKNLRGARPDFTYSEVKPSPMNGIYQVQVEQGPLLYVNKEGTFILTGSLYGVVAGGFVDMQELALKPVRKEKLDAIPQSEKVVFSPKGESKAYIHVFTDVDCGYCRILHQDIPKLNAMGIEVRYLGYPRAGLGSPSHRKIAAAWCADDRQGTMDRLKNLQKVDVAYCEDNPVAKHFRLGSELGVSGTPAIILADGSLLPGYIPAEQLARQLGL